MPATRRLVVRDDSSNITPTMFKLLIALVVLTVTAILLIAALLIMRAIKRSRDNKQESSERVAFAQEKPDNSAYRRLTIDTMHTTPAYAYQEKRSLMESNSPPQSPLPEIRITFPDETDHSGRPQSGRVVVVRMGDNNAMGLEPLSDALPPYEKNNERFESLDLDRMGGLKEKELEKRWN